VPTGSVVNLYRNGEEIVRVPANKICPPLFLQEFLNVFDILRLEENGSPFNVKPRNGYVSRCSRWE